MKIFDVGANKGDFTKHVIDNCEYAEVQAFEPNISICFESLNKIATENPDKLFVNWVALGKDSGKGNFFGGNLMNGQLGSLLPLNHESKGWNLHKEVISSVEIRSTPTEITIVSVRELSNNLFNLEIDFLKIDTQGTDVLILSEFLEYFHVKAGVVEVTVGEFFQESRYIGEVNDINSLVQVLQKYDYKILKILPNNQNADELNVFFAKSEQDFKRIVSELNLSDNPIFARYWKVLGVGKSQSENTQVLTLRFMKKIFKAFFHPRSSLESFLLKVTK
jgi:FkbM family methyltransferase